jgi:single-strand DNA-binding protein
VSVNTNVAIITGNLTRDPELRSTHSGKSVCSLRVAVNRMTDKGTDFINVTVWNGAAEACAKYLSKGSPVAVTGSIRTGEYEKQDGSGKVYTTEISAQRVEFLNRRGTSGESEQPMAVEPSTERPDDDDIPF